MTTTRIEEPQLDQLLEMDETCAALRLGRATVKKLIDRGELRALRVGKRKIAVSIREIRRYRRRCEM